MLRLDLMRLESAERFQLLCARIARRSFPDAIPLAFASWDGGRDIVRMGRLENGVLIHDIVWQAKFTDRLNSTTQRAIRGSIASIQNNAQAPVSRWILCLPIDPTGVFLDWLARELPTNWKWDVWGATTLLEKLEANPDLVEIFFYAAYEELRQIFAVERLELIRFQLDGSCQWSQLDSKILNFKSRNVKSPDLVFDLIVRNSGRTDAVLMSIEVQVIERESKLHGYPGEGLLFPQVTYEVSVNEGRVGTYRSICEPPLIVHGDSVERFKIRIRDTGYGWSGTILVTLDYGSDKRLRLPALRLYV